MKTTTMGRSAGVLLVAAALAGCATPGQPAPSGPPKGTALSCEPLVWQGPVRETVRPEDWYGKVRDGQIQQRMQKGTWHLPRGYIHIRFVEEPSGVYAILVPVVELRAEAPLVVGPMENVTQPFPQDEDEAHKMLETTPRWSFFYRALFAVYSHWRPMGLVCPGKDCRMTPESPPPPLHGMTSTYKTGYAALATPQPDQALALLQEKPTGETATDALRVPPPGTARTPTQESLRLSVVQDTVARAVCAAQILAGRR